MKLVLSILMAALVAISLVPSTASADRRDYHPPGKHITKLPRHHHAVSVGKRRYFYHGGHFYQPRNRGYVVVTAPIGARVGSLPAGAISFGIGSHRYYHVNATYYLWRKQTKDYVVVAKPEGADAAVEQTTEVASAEVYVYPKIGQDDDARDRDRFECHLWAVEQTGFDPSLGKASAEGSSNYKRAISACLEGRGYTVR